MGWYQRLRVSRCIHPSVSLLNQPADRWADETTMELSIKQLLADQELLYQAGARNFLFINIPPINRTPTGANPNAYVAEL